MALPESLCVSCWKLAFTLVTNPTLEPAYGRVHLWLAQRDPHHGPDPDRADAGRRSERDPRNRAKGGRVLFVGTKRQASGPIADAAEKSAQYYMNHRWLGGHPDQLADRVRSRSTA